MEEWGALLLKYYQKNLSYKENDFTNNYLGYWTDNGELNENLWLKVLVYNNNNVYSGSFKLETNEWLITIKTSFFPT